jgi:signal peptidase I
MKNKYKIIALIGIALIAIAIARAFAEPYRVSGDCMEPAIQDGKLYFLNHISPYLRQYQVGDIIVFKHGEKLWISRIVALETNTIQITEGSVMVNGSPLQESQINRNWSGWKLGTHAID